MSEGAKVEEDTRTPEEKLQAGIDLLLTGLAMLTDETRGTRRRREGGIMATDTLSGTQAEELASIRDECEALIEQINGLLLADTEGVELPPT